MFFRSYRKIKEIGVGAFSKVFLYQHRISKQNVALKRIQKKNHNEIKHMKIFKGNSRICQLHDTFDKGDHSHLVMHYYPNGELFEPLKQHYYDTPNKVQKLMLELCQIVQLCHRENIAHLDIKPREFFI